MPDPEPSDPGPFVRVNRVFPRPGDGGLKPRKPPTDRPDFGDVGRSLSLLRSYRTTYGMVQLRLKMGESPEAIRAEYQGRIEVLSSRDPRDADATREALEDALSGRPPRR